MTVRIECLIHVVAVATIVLFLIFPRNCAAQGFLPFTSDAGIFDPSQGPLAVGYQLFRDASEIEVKVIDFRGQVADRFTFVDLRAGDHRFVWDGTDNNGELVPDGRYQFVVSVVFTDGSRDAALIDVMVAHIESRPGIQVPEPLPAVDYPHRLYGSFSTLYRYNDDQDQDDGEARLRAGLDYQDENNTVRGVFQAIQDYDGSSATFNGTQVMAERRWLTGKAKGVFRDNLGNFRDPLQLFSDFKTERNKLGFTVDQGYDRLSGTAVFFSSEGDVDSQEQGAAARLSYGEERSWLVGTSFTYRRAVDEYFSDERQGSHAAAADLQYWFSESFSIAAEAVTTDDEVLGSDQGYALKGEYDLGAIRFSAGYTYLGENFKADFADPLHNVDRDAQGFDAGVDYFMPQPLWIFSNLAATLRFFNLTRHSDDSTVREIDGSLRLGIGSADTLFLSMYNREDEFGANTNCMGSLMHRWDDSWSTMLQANYTDTDTSDSLRFMLTTSYTRAEVIGRLSVEWTRRTIDYSRFSPYDQGYIRFDLSDDLWHFQLQTKYSRNGEKSGMNVFSRLDYKPEFLHRYQALAYISLGNRSSIETEAQCEIGFEVQF
ncbi:MAG: hypothetical protein KQH59_16545 [Desulfobulbaceae bacterium]|nr:hypothetical protein [Desulfobulbaceae bacterium]